MSKDLWHKAALAPGESPCRACRGARTAATKVHGQKGRYAARWDVKVNGRRVQKSERFETRAAADDHENEMRAAVRGGRYRDRARGDVTLEHWAGQWLALTAPDRTESTTESLEYSVNSSVLPHLGGMTLAELQYEPAVIRGWVNELKGENRGDGSILKAFTIVSAMLDAAVESNRMAANPCRQKSAKPRGLEQKPRLANWTPEAVAAVYLASPGVPRIGWRPHEGPSAWDRYRAAVLAAAGCGGMRMGEVIGLAKDDVRFMRREIAITTTVVRARGQRYYSQTKTAAGARTAAMPECVRYALAAHMDRYPPVAITLPSQVKGKPMETWPLITRELLFYTEEGTPVVGPGLQSALRYALAYAGLIPELDGKRGAGSTWRRYPAPSLYGLHFHALRNFYVSLLLDAGVPLPVVKEQVGHKRAGSLGVQGLGHHRDVTLDTYARPMAGSAARVREVVDAALGPLLDPDRSHFAHMAQ